MSATPEIAAHRTPPIRGACRHCGERPANRPRGLCFRCYVPGIRERYPSLSIYAPREIRGLVGVPERTSDLPMPAEPCPYAPGTPEQMGVLAGRVARGEQLWHPDDRRDCEGLVGHPSRAPDPPAAGLCRHCRRAPANASRGLCRHCWDQEDVRRQYPCIPRPKGRLYG